jgi:hypothetical protein
MWKMETALLIIGSFGKRTLNSKVTIRFLNTKNKSENITPYACKRNGSGFGWKNFWQV